MTPQERAFCYQYFSEFFRGTFNPALQENWPVIAELTQSDPSDLKLDQSVRQDWARTFFGVGHETVTLTQSTWLNSLRLQCQEPCRAAHDAYVKAGVQPNNGEDALPDDHASVLMGFMAWSLVSDRPEGETKEFFAAHFSGWWNSFLKAAKTYLNNPKINRVIESCEKFLEQEREIFS